MSCCQNYNCFDGCKAIFDTICIDYTGDPLPNLGSLSGDLLEEILIDLNNAAPSHVEFSANSTNSIYAVGGGSYGHAPLYYVRIKDHEDNLIELRDDGLFVDGSSGGDGKVKVDEDDTKDYLENQFGGDSNGILTVTPVKDSGKMKFVPSINAENLLEIIQSSYKTQFCDIIQDCIAGI